MKVFMFLSTLVAVLLVAISHFQVTAQSGNLRFSRRDFEVSPVSQFVDRRGDLIPQESYYYQSSYYPSHQHHGHGHGHGHGGHGGHGHGGHGHGGHGHGGHRHGWGGYGHGWHHRPRVHHIYHHKQRQNRVLPTLLAGFAAGSAIAIGAGLASGAIGK